MFLFAPFSARDGIQHLLPGRRSTWKRLLVQLLTFGHQDNAQKLSDIQNPFLVRFYFCYDHVSFSSFSTFTIAFPDNPSSL